MHFALSGFSAIGGPDERNLVSYFAGVQHGLKELGCRAALRIYMWGQSKITKFNESYCVFSCRHRIEIMRAVRIRSLANPWVFPAVKCSEPTKCSSLPCPRSEQRTGTKLCINLCSDYVNFKRKESDNIIIQRCYQYFTFTIISTPAGNLHFRNYCKFDARTLYNTTKAFHFNLLNIKEER